MARAKKKSVSQTVVGVATSGMPAPVQKLLGNRVIALLIVLSIPVMWATGLVTVEWENGQPKLTINQQKAAAAKEKAAAKLHDIREERNGVSSEADHNAFREFTGRDNSWSGFAAEDRQQPAYVEQVMKRAEELAPRVSDQPANSWGSLPSIEHNDPPAKRANPLSRLKRTVDSRR